jgi:hypothetical protein
VLGGAVHPELGGLYYQPTLLTGSGLHASRPSWWRGRSGSTASSSAKGGTWSFDFYGDVKNTVYAPEGWRHG